MKKWLMADLHIHSTFSDGTEPVEEIIKIYGEAGFDVVSITDHLFDTQTPRSLEIYEEGKSIKDIEVYFQKIKEVSQWAKQTFDLLVIPGLEICNLSEDYHILGIDLKEPINPNQDANGVIDDIHRQGGLAIASHPPLKLSFFLKGDNESIRRHPLHLWNNRAKYVNKIDAWEIANRDDLFDRVSLEGLPYIASSDFHHIEHFSSWKSLIFSDKSAEAIKTAIRERQISLFYFHEKRKGRKPVKIWANKENRVYTNSSEMEGQEKILIVDDEKDLVALIAQNLKAKGYSVLTAINGLEAWEKIQSEKPDTIVLDLMMPDLDGWELCQIIRRAEDEEIRAIGILILSARALPEDKVYGLEIGADDYLTKPFSMAELVLRVEKIIKKRRTTRGLVEQMNRRSLLIEKKEENLRKIIHDLKTPLVSIGAAARLLLRREQIYEKSKSLGSIYEASLTLTRWVDEVLKASHLSFQELENQMQEVEIESLIKGVIDLLRDFAQKKGVKILFRPSPSKTLLRGNETLLQRTLSNLLSNALNYTPRGGQVEVSVIFYISNGDKFVKITIKDNGIGILEEDIEKIFEPFYRGKNAHKETGIGLGLTFVKEVVDLHQGKITVQSKPQKGSNFSVLLPIKSGPIGK